MKHEITFEIFGKRLKTKIEAETEQEALNKCYEGIIKQVKIIEHMKEAEQKHFDLDDVLDVFDNIFKPKK